MYNVAWALFRASHGPLIEQTGCAKLVSATAGRCGACTFTRLLWNLDSDRLFSVLWNTVRPSTGLGTVLHVRWMLLGRMTSFACHPKFDSVSSQYLWLYATNFSGSWHCQYVDKGVRIPEQFTVFHALCCVSSVRGPSLFSVLYNIAVLLQYLTAGIAL